MSEHPSDLRRRQDALAGSLALRLGLLSFDELRVVDVIIERILKLGRESYAPLDLTKDERDWSAEAAAELADTLFYLAARDVAANDRRLERLRCEVADEINAGSVDRGLAELRQAPAIRAVPYGVSLEFGECFDDTGGES